MRRSRFLWFVASTVLAGSTVVVLSTPAVAAKPGIACKAVSGYSGSNVTFSKCTGHTGKAAMPMSSMFFARDESTITWANNHTTTVTFGTGDQDPRCGSSQGYSFLLKTKSDTTGSAKIGGKIKVHICVDTIGAITFLPGTHLTIQ